MNPLIQTYYNNGGKINKLLCIVKMEGTPTGISLYFECHFYDYTSYSNKASSSVLRMSLVIFLPSFSSVSNAIILPS